MGQPENDPERVMANAVRLHDAAAVDRAFDRMAAAISNILAGNRPVVLCVLNGGIIPTGHILTRLEFPLELDYLHATRYRGDTTGDAVHWICEPQISLQGRDVLLIDDILDEGHTLHALIEHCRQAGAANVYSAVLVRKLHARCAEGIAADFVGLEVEDKYVFGMGMDYKGYLRNLNGIYVLGGGNE